MYGNSSTYTGFPSSLDSSLTSAHYNTGTSPLQRYNGLSSTNGNTRPSTAQTYGMYANNQDNKYDQLSKQSENFGIENSDFKSGTEVNDWNEDKFMDNDNLLNGVTSKDKGRKKIICL